MTFTRTQLTALRRALRRPGANLCPMGLRGNAEQMVIEALERRGLVRWDGMVPRLSDAAFTLLES